MEQFEVSIRSENGVRRIRVRGELDLSTADELIAACSSVERSFPLLLDLTDCEFMDSTGIRALILCKQRTEGRGDAFAIVGAAGEVRRVLRLTGIGRQLGCFDDEGQALTILTGQSESSPPA